VSPHIKRRAILKIISREGGFQPPAGLSNYFAPYRAHTKMSFPKEPQPKTHDIVILAIFPSVLYKEHLRFTVTIEFILYPKAAC
jgi:hypothetical protein